MSSHSLDVALESQATLAEGPFWDAPRRVLWWVDIEGQSVHRFDPSTGRDRRLDVGQRVGALICREDGGLILALHDGLAEADPETGKYRILHQPEAGMPDNRFNDAKCDPDGRLWAGTMNFVNEAAGTGALYSLDGARGLRKHLTGVGVSNGLAWSADGSQFFYVDSKIGTIDGFDFDRARGQLSNRRVVFRTPTDLGAADGMTIDAEGMLWVGFWGGWCCGRIDPLKGELIDKIELPVANVTSCAFGGPDLDELYMTTAAHGLSADDRKTQPHAGDLFVARPRVLGTPSVTYRG